MLRSLISGKIKKDEIFARKINMLNGSGGAHHYTVPAGYAAALVRDFWWAARAGDAEYRNRAKLNTLPTLIALYPMKADLSGWHEATLFPLEQSLLSFYFISARVKKMQFNNFDESIMQKFPKYFD
jgi:hypothetical protein